MVGEMFQVLGPTSKAYGFSCRKSRRKAISGASTLERLSVVSSIHTGGWERGWRGGISDAEFLRFLFEILEGEEEKTTLACFWRLCWV